MSAYKRLQQVTVLRGWKCDDDDEVEVVLNGWVVTCRKLKERSQVK